MYGVQLGPSAFNDQPLPAIVQLAIRPSPIKSSLRPPIARYPASSRLLLFLLHLLQTVYIHLSLPVCVLLLPHSHSVCISIGLHLPLPKIHLPSLHLRPSSQQSSSFRPKSKSRQSSSLPRPVSSSQTSVNLPIRAIYLLRSTSLLRLAPSSQTSFNLPNPTICYWLLLRSAPICFDLLLAAVLHQFPSQSA
ncbi:hypothetical protein ACLOJK_018737 [Asimina triloba]